MTDFDAVERALVDAARVGMSPGPEQHARVLERTLASVSRSAPESLVQRDAASLRFPARRLLAVGVLVGAAGLAGYALGRRDGRAEAVARVAPSAALATRSAPLEHPPPSAPRVPQPAVPGPSDASATSETKAAHHPRAPLGTAASEPSKGTSELGRAQALLDQELGMVRRVERALRDANPRLALGLLGELDRAVPNGKLGEERRAARVIASCQLAPADAAARLAEFSRAHPSSVYLDRVRQSCAASEPQKP